MIMILFGALYAGTKTYLLCRSDRQAFTSAFCNTLPMGCLKFCFSLEIRSSNLKPSFEEQLQTVHLQRKVNFLQQKLVEKSKAIPTNDKPEHSTAKKISPKTNIKANNTNSSTQTKITVDQKKTGQGRRIVNAQTQGKDPPCAEKRNKDQHAKYKKTNFIIAGDSMLNYIEGQRLSNKKRFRKIHDFPGATTEDMYDFMRSLA